MVRDLESGVYILVTALSFRGLLSTFVGPRALDPTQKQFGCTMKVKCHVKNVMQAMNSMKARRDDVLRNIQEAERLQRTHIVEVSDWLQKVAKIEARVDMIQERYQERCLGFGCCGWSNYRFSKEVLKILAKVEKLIANVVFQEVVVKIPVAIVEEMPNPPNVVGMMSNLEMVLCYLDRGDEKISIGGMGGVGETTLLRSVNNVFLPVGERSNQFHYVIWAVASFGYLAGITVQILVILPRFTTMSLSQLLPSDLRFNV